MEFHVKCIYTFNQITIIINNVVSQLARVFELVVGPLNNVKSNGSVRE